MGFYQSAAWHRLRKQALHDAGWKCVRCGADLVGLGRAAHVHHRKRVKRAPALALEPQNLMPLCVECHSQVHANHDALGCDVNGWPTGKAHPWNVDGGMVSNLETPLRL